MKVIRYKTWYDIWENKGRTLQVVLIIAISAFAIGTTMGAPVLINKDMGQTWASTQPPMIGLWVDPPINQAMLDSLDRFEGVETIEGRQVKEIEWRASPDESWQTATLQGRPDYDDQKLNAFQLDEGAWPERKMMAVERGRGFAVSDKVYIKVNDKAYLVTIGGIVFNTMVDPPIGNPNPTFYTTQERFGHLTGQPNYDTFYARLPSYNEETALALADDLQAHLEKQEYDVGSALLEDFRTTDPTIHPYQDGMNGFFFLLTTMSTLALILGLFLVFNTVTAMITQQVKQIGVMKAVGATFGQVVWVFFQQVFIYGILALLLAIPLGVAGAQGIRVFFVGVLNMNPGPIELVPEVMAVQAAVALFSPLVVAILPILSGTRITVREAISSYGLGVTASLLDRLIANFQAMPRSIALTLGNTFRNKGRVFFTQVTLVGSGLIFMMVMSTQASLVYTFNDALFSIFDANVLLRLEDNERIVRMETLAYSHPDVTGVELWASGNGKMRPAGQSQSNDDRSANLRGIPLPTQTYNPDIRAGRWLEPGDTYAVVLHQKLAAEVGVGVGDWVTIDILQKGKTQWQVVGLSFSPINETATDAPRETLLKELGEVGLARWLRIKTVQADADSEARIANELRTLFEAKGYPFQPDSVDTVHRVSESAMAGMYIVIGMLAGMAVIIAIVGGIALSGALSINVLERRREIGVMRAIGGASSQILWVFLGEGLLLAWLSWLIAWPLSIPLGRLMTTGLQDLLETELTYQYSLTGTVYWFGIVTILALAASFFPARGATKVSVQQSLAYQ
ncbi:MAG: ABC transporter permease [Anaerolineae bacterium]|nr:ABC transporter permease [Anaerolineae bacterium]